MTELKKISWTNVWNAAGSLHADGCGSKTHLTEVAAGPGKTLCGKQFPGAEGRGHSSGIGFCKRCAAKAYAAGQPKGFSRRLEWID